MAKEIVIGDYVLVEKIGEGGFGRTFLGKHRLLETPVCIKQSNPPDEDSRQVYNELLKQEARSVWGISHPNLPVMLNYIEHPDPTLGVFIVMSYVEGVPLHNDIQENGPLEDEHVMWVTQRILDGLGYLHYHEVIHCDVKPPNVILQLEQHEAVLVDLGVAITSPDRHSMAIGATEGYAPPEFAAQKPPLPCSDFYSLGKVVIFMAGGDPETGQIPSDMCDPLKKLVEEMTVHDAVKRRELLGDDARHLSSRITEIRQQVYGRTESVELVKRR